MEIHKKDKIIDGGGTRVITTYLTLTFDGVEYKRSAPTYFYLNKTTGNITILGRIKDISKHNVIIEYKVNLKNPPNKLYTKKAK